MCVFVGVMFLWVVVCVRVPVRVCVCVCVCVCPRWTCLFVHSLNRSTGRFVRGKLVYWSLNRVNEETSQAEGTEERGEERGEEGRRGGEEE